MSFYFTEVPKLARSQLDPVISFKSPLKVLGGCSYFDLLPFLLLVRCLDRDKDGRDDGYGEVIKVPLSGKWGKTNNINHLILLWLFPLLGFRCILAIVSPRKPWTRGPVRAHLRPHEFAMDPLIRTPYSLHK
jgi:hypothetical protein